MGGEDRLELLLHVFKSCTPKEAINLFDHLTVVLDRHSNCSMMIQWCSKNDCSKFFKNFQNLPFLYWMKEMRVERNRSPEKERERGREC